MSGTTDRRSSRLLWLRTVSERGQRHYPIFLVLAGLVFWEDVSSSKSIRL